MKKITHKRTFVKKFRLLSLASFTIGLLLSLHLSAKTKSSQTADWFNLIMERVQERHKTSMPLSTVTGNTSYYLTILNPDGSFNNIDYDDQSQTNWKPLGHLDRLKSLVLAYTIPTSRYYNDTVVYNAIVNAFSFWQAKHPISTNWFNQQVACPQRMGVMLILMRSAPKQLPKELEDQLIERMRVDGNRPDQPGSLGSAANKIDIATHWVYRGCLTRDEAVLSFGVNQVYYPVYLTTGEGLQIDFSYHQHGNQIQIGGYGFVYLDAVSSIAAYMVDTPYALSGEKLDYLSRYLREMHIPVLRGKYLQYNLLGRGIARKGALNQGGFHTLIERMKLMDPTHTQYYNDAISRIKGTQPTSYALEAYTKHFWRSDYTLHQRPGYTFDVRSASIYTTRNENGNGENLKGYFLTDGATSVVMNGDEYFDIFPVWDWTRIPGVTSPVRTSIPRPSQWEKPGSSTFAGGVSDGKYGVSTFHYNDNAYTINTSARKSWFMFDDEIVCLGADIKSTATEQINTTVEQNLLKGDVVVNVDGVESTLTKGSRSYTNLKWAHHNSVGYIFPKSANITLSNNTQSGTWNSISSSLGTEAVTADVFKMWFNHGVAPTNGSYEYIIVPNKATVADLANYNSANIEIIANTGAMQAVRHKSLNILGIVFHSAGKLELGDIVIEASNACAVIFKNIGTTNVEVYVSDPSRVLSSVTFKTTLPGITGESQLVCTLPKHPDAYAGSTKSFVINENTSKIAAKTYDYVYVTDDAYVRDGSYETTNYGTGNLVVKKDFSAGYSREAYMKFDLSNINPSTFTKAHLAFTISSANISISTINWIVGYSSDDNWTQNNITWATKPVIESQIATTQGVGGGQKVMVDITNIVLEEINNGNKVLTLQISASDRGLDGKTDANIFSIEYADKTKIPQLMLEKSETESVDIIVKEDAWVRNGATNENINNGSSSTLIVKQDNLGYAREAFVKFNIESLTANAIQNVVLKLAVSNANTSISTIKWQIQPVPTTWSESTLTWTNKPALGSIIASAVGQAAGTVVEFDVTEYIKTQLANGAKDIAFAITGSGVTDGKTDAQFFSKESTDTSKHARLSVVTTATASTKSLVVESAKTQSEIVTYPNPVTRGENATIQLSKDSETASIYVIDMTGRVMQSVKNKTIETHMLSTGIYLISVKDSVNKENNGAVRLIVK